MVAFNTRVYLAPDLEFQLEGVFGQTLANNKIEFYGVFVKLFVDFS